jgi:endonuclease/exonuclease/phosphatase family metal-dependent hydrolase
LQRLRLVTWNVLHRIHGEKWSKYVVEHFPDERARIERVTARVAGWLAEGADAVCLQEVSGDQLASLRDATKATAHSHCYARVPGWLYFWSKPLADPSEHLVTLAPGEGRAAEAVSFVSDAGKGLLAVDLGGVRVVNTHLTFGEPGAAQLRQAAEALRRGGRGVLAGDLNATRDAVAAVLGPQLALSQVERPTRVPPRPDEPGKVIDHVACLGGELQSVEVLDAEGLSDHHPVRAVVRFG